MSAPKRLSPRRPPSTPHLPTLLAAALLTFAIAGCESRGTPPDTWKEVELAEQPRLFERRMGHPALADLEGLHLGQPHDAAIESLREYCERTVRRNSGALGRDAYFVGCRLEKKGPLKFIRVGFWPKIGDRTATLEIKRAPVPPAAVYGRIRESLDEPIAESSLRSRVVQVKTRHYRFYADWEQGLDGPTHLVVGFAPQIDRERAVPDP